MFTKIGKVLAILFAGSVYFLSGLYHGAHCDHSLVASLTMSVLAGFGTFIVIATARGEPTVAQRYLNLRQIESWPFPALCLITIMALFATGVCLYVLAHALGLPILLWQVLFAVWFSGLVIDQMRDLGKGLQ